MKTARKSLVKLRRDIIASVKQPHFLLDPNTPLSQQSLSWNSAYRILYAILDAVSGRLLERSEIRNIVIEITLADLELQRICSEKEHLLVWLFVGDLVESWIKEAVKVEEFEIAANLKAITKSWK